MPNRSEQARINGAKSHGPKTAEGLRRCVEANTTHGAYAAAANVLSHEDAEAYAATHEAARRQYRPANAYEDTLVALIVDHLWNQRRMLNAANALVRAHASRLAEQPATASVSPSGIHLGAQLAAKEVELFERRARHHAREHARAIRALADARKCEKIAEESQESKKTKEVSAAAPVQAPPAAAPEPRKPAAVAAPVEPHPLQ